MKKPLLSEADKKRMASQFIKGNVTQADLARQYGVSTRTVQRALIEHNVLPPRVAWTREQVRIVQVVQFYGLSSDELQQILRRSRAVRALKKAS